MKRFGWIISAAILLALPACAAAQNQAATHSQESQNQTSFAVYPNGAPGFEDRLNIPETAQGWWVRDIHNPSLTPVLPNEQRSRVAIITVPGGGHKDLVFNSEGLKPAQYLADLGIPAFALKYRLARQPGSDYDIETHAGEDLRQANRTLRAKSSEYGVDQIGILAFSAGGELANLAAFDSKDDAAARPDFMIQIYPGPIGLPDHSNAPLPPAFFLTAFDDTGPTQTILRHMQFYREHEGSAEAHFFAQGGHAFNMGGRSELNTISQWPDRLEDWLVDSGYLEPAAD